MVPAENGVPLLVLGVVLVLVGLMVHLVARGRPARGRSAPERALFAVGLFGWTVVIPLMGVAGIVIGGLSALRG